jgi:two-component system response regulator ArlR
MSAGFALRQWRILLIEADEALAAEIASTLQQAGYHIVTAGGPLEGLKKLYEFHPDLVIMARELLPADGESSFLRLRQASYLPIVVVGSQKEAAETLESGADAYVTTPPNLTELLARVRSLLRRKRQDDGPLGTGERQIKGTGDNPGNGSNGLTPTEFRLASCLALNEGRLLDYHRLVNEVWGGKEVTLDTLHFYIRRLRQKLARAGIFMLRGVGYYFSGDGSRCPSTNSKGVIADSK